MVDAVPDQSCMHKTTDAPLRLRDGDGDGDGQSRCVLRPSLHRSASAVANHSLRPAGFRRYSLSNSLCARQVGSEMLAFHQRYPP
jgi:hypothetical protein